MPTFEDLLGALLYRGLNMDKSRVRLPIAALWLCLLALTGGCGNVPEDVSRSWETNMQVAILKGSTGFRAEFDSSEDGVFFFSYIPPVSDANPLTLLRAQVESLDSCLTPVNASAAELWLRCDRHRPLPPQPQEIRALRGARSGRLFVMYAQRVHKADRYDGFHASLRRMAERDRH